ncbi:MAG: translation initiation factor IF-1 [Pseudomonadota bacterium]
MSRDDHIEMDGAVTEVLRGGMYRVKLENDHEILATTAGKMRQFKIRIVLGDSVRVAISPYDLNRGRIIYRSR